MHQEKLSKFPDLTDDDPLTSRYISGINSIKVSVTLPFLEQLSTILLISHYNDMTDKILNALTSTQIVI
jgi:hypothetical protein